MEDQTKKRLFKIQMAAVVLGAVILLIWIFNLKNVWRLNGELATAKEQGAWQVLQDNLSQALTNANDQLKRIQNSQATTASSTAQEAAGRDLLSGLLEETKKIASSSTSTSASTSAAVKKDCPAWVNCMPSIGEMRSCVIPPGCEGITQKAY